MIARVIAFSIRHRAAVILASRAALAHFSRSIRRKMASAGTDTVCAPALICLSISWLHVPAWISVSCQRSVGQ